MITTSQKWKDLYANIANDLLPESDLIVSNSNDVSAPITDSMASTLSGQLIVGDVYKATSKTGKYTTSEVSTNNKKYATCELNYFILDGSFDFYDYSNPVKEDKYISGIVCGGDCQFGVGTGEGVGIKLSGAPTAKNFVTMKFEPNQNEFATKFKIVDTATNKETEINLDEYDTTYQMFQMLTTTNSIKVIFTEWNKPYRRARVDELILGKRFWFDKRNMTSCTLKKSVDMISAELPKNDLGLEIEDINNDYDVWNSEAKFVHEFNTNSIFAIYARFKIDDAWELIQIDACYFRGLDRPQQGITAKITLENVLQKMTQKIPSFQISANIIDQNSAPNKWDSYQAFVYMLSNVCGRDIAIWGGNSVYNKKRSRMHQPFTGMTIDKGYEGSTTNRITEMCRLWDDYFQTEVKDLLQIASLTISNYIFINEKGSVILKHITESNGKLSDAIYYGAEDTIYLDQCYSYPVINKLDVIKNVKISPLYKSLEQRTEGSNINHIETISYNFASNGIDQNIDDKLIFAITATTADDNPAWGVVDSTAEADNPLKILANYVNSFISDAIKISAECIINPAWQVADVINIETKSGKIYKGFLTSIELKYEGIFKGTVEILVPKSFQ